MNKNIVILLILLLSITVYSQETAPNVLLYRYNMNILNPAYAGVDENSEIGLGFRKRQMDFQDDSSTQYVYYSKGFGRNLGFGVSVVNDKFFISKETSAVIDASYKLQFDRVTNLYFGMKAGGRFYTIDPSSLDVNDPLLSGNESTFSPSVGLGAYLKGERYYINVSIPNILLGEVQKPKFNQSGTIISESTTEKLNVYFGAGYQFSLSETIDFTPAVFSRFTADEDMLLDISAITDFSNKVEVGLTYRLNTSVIGSLMLKVIKNTSIGYAYESTTSEFSTVSSGTHEFIMKFSW